MTTASSIGLVLSGGGVFGAWETGALHAFFEWWRATNSEEPPIRVVVGTSTGALISPFALLGRQPDHDYLAEVIELYGTVTNAKLRIERPELLLRLQPSSCGTSPSVYDAGYRDNPADAAHLYKLLRKMLPAGSNRNDRRLVEYRAAPRRRDAGLRCGRAASRHQRAADLGHTARRDFRVRDGTVSRWPRSRCRTSGRRRSVGLTWTEAFTRRCLSALSSISRR